MQLLSRQRKSLAVLFFCRETRCLFVVVTNTPLKVIQPVMEARLVVWLCPQLRARPWILVGGEGVGADCGRF